MNVIRFQQVLDLPAGKPDHMLAYGPAAAQFGELWLPDQVTQPAPLIILIHGGCWLNAFDVSHTHPMSTALTETISRALAP